MSVIGNQTNINETQYFFLEVNSKLITTSTIKANTGIFSTIFAQDAQISSITGAVNISTLNLNYLSSQRAYISSLTSDVINTSTITSKSINASTINTKYIELYKDPITSNFPLWNSNTDYDKNNYVLHNNQRYQSIRRNLNVVPDMPVDFWYPFTDYYQYNYGWVEGVGLYECFSNISGSIISPNGDPAHWSGVSGSRAVTQIWKPLPYIYSGIEGDKLSYINVGNANISTIKAFDISSLTGYVSTFTTDHISSQTASISSLNTRYISSTTASISSIFTQFLTVSSLQTTFGLFSSLVAAVANFSSITVSSIFISSIINSNLYLNDLTVNNLYSSNIFNQCNITTANLDVTNEAAIMTLLVPGETELNTLITGGNVDMNGAVTTNEALNVNGGIFLNSDINGSTNSYPSYDGEQTQWFNSINNILNTTTNSLTVIGCGTGNGFDPFLPLRNNSIVNIGQTEFSPGIVNIYGVNLADTYALSVYGSTYLGGFLTVLGDSTINGLFTVNGISDLNGDTTVLGFLDCLGTLDVAGLTTFTGAVNTAGLVTVQGEMNITGAFTTQTGMGIVGATTFQLGDIIIGDSPGGGVANNYNVYIYYNGLDIQNITVNGTGDFRQSVGVDGNLTVAGLLTASNFTVSNIITPSITVTDINVSNLTVNTSANINAPLYVRQNDLLSLNPIITFENSTLGRSATIELVDGLLNINSDEMNIGATSNLVIGSACNVVIGSANPITVFSQLTLKEYPALNTNPTKLTFENDDATRSASIDFDASIRLLSIQASNLTFTGGQTASLTAPQTNVLGQTNVGIGAGRTVNILADSNIFMKGVSSIILNSDDIGISGKSNAIIFSEFGNVGLVSVGATVIGGGSIQIQSSCNIDIGASGNIFSQCDGELTLNSFSNTLITATGFIQVGAVGDAQFVSTAGRCILASGGSNDVEINAVGGGNIIANTFNFGNIVLYNGSNNGIGIGATGVFIASDNIIEATALDTITLNAPVVDIPGSNTVIQSISTLRLSTGTFFAGNITTSNIIASNITTPALSTTIISTATIFTNFINAPVNINVGKSIIPSGATIDLGAQGFNYRQLFISSIRCVSSIITSTITTDRLFPTFDSGVRTANLYPQSFGSQIGFGAALASGGFYNQVCARSTITTNFVPASDGATTANNIKVAGHLSTVSLGVSTINFKQYPFISTLSNSIVTTTATTVSGTPGLTRLQSNALRFPFPGTYNITQKYSISKGSGGGIHGCLIYDSNGATTTTVANANNWSRMGMASVPFHDQAGVSTFTTAVTTVLANSANLTRDLYYYDSGSGNYTASFYITQPTIEYIPRPGILPEA